MSLATLSCSNRDKDEHSSERALYQSAQKALNSSQYDFAIEQFRKIELRYPFGRYAEQAQLESIYAYYQNGELAASAVAAERFIRQHPEHPNLDYAQYLKGLSNYHIDSGLISRLVYDASVKRDLNSAKQAFEDFKLLIELYPESDYVADARQRMLYIRDLIARQEVEIANYYMERAAYVGAVNRAKSVVENYPGTTASADALAILVQAYRELGSPELALDSLQVLKHNFPDYDKLLPDGSLAPYDRLYQEKVNWLNFISFGYLGKTEAEEPISEGELRKAISDKAPEPPTHSSIPQELETIEQASELDPQ